MSRSTGMCESDDGQDDLMSRSTGMCESDEARIVRGWPLQECSPGIRSGCTGSTMFEDRQLR